MSTVINNTANTSNSKIIVGLSGGVDSSVAAALLKQAGHAVQAVFMKNWEEDDRADGFCPASQDFEDAQKVADQLGIDLQPINFAHEYWEQVFAYFLEEYKAGRTPNPDILCNKEIKFKAFLDYAESLLGASHIATGHYARLARNPQTGYLDLLKGLDANKDQSYFLYAVPQGQFQKALFPVGDLEKSQVRKIAASLNLSTATKKDSTGICFIGERKFKTFLQQYLPAQPGEIRSLDTDKKLGQHDGLMYYTLGQRQGLQIGGSKAGSGQPWYVAEKDLKQNILWVVQGEGHPALLQNSLEAGQLNWLLTEEELQAKFAPGETWACAAKVRYRQQEQACVLEWKAADLVQARFETSQRAITPGQSVVFYEGNRCLGGGVINRASAE
ncbi:MAG: tRNA 2-thiouridine(34) synthase MnmA [Gammaproteobacteria bacterium]